MRIYVLLAVIFVLAGCDKIPDFKDSEEFTYRDCIREAMAGSHSFSANETRSLCKEITEKVMSYEYDNGKLVPQDDYTACMEPKMAKLRKRDLSKEDMELESLLAEVECLDAE